MTDLIQVMSKLVTPQGDILVPGINDLVAPLTEEERYGLFPKINYADILCLRKRYEGIDYSIDDVDASAGASIAVSSSISEV